ncbi:Os09g0451266, partial [Oryza sativa Japonica Group]
TERARPGLLSDGDAVGGLGFHGLERLEPGLLGLELVAHVQLHVVLEHELGVRHDGLLLLHQRRRRGDHGVAARVVERRDGHPVAVGLRHHPVDHALVPAVGDHLQLVAEVDDDGVAHGRHVHPLAVLEQLEATDAVVLEEQDDAAGVGVGAEALDEVGARARRVAADLGAEGGCARGATEGLGEVALLEAEVLAEQVQ